MAKTFTDIMLTHTLLDNTINLENSIIEKNCMIIDLRKEIQRLNILICRLTEENLNLVKINIGLTKENYTLVNEVIPANTIPFL
jgi:hypothetical protein